MKKIKIIGLIVFLALFLSNFSYAQKLPGKSKTTETQTEQQETGKLPGKSVETQEQSTTLPGKSKTTTTTAKTTNKTATSNTGSKEDYFTGYVVSLDGVLKGDYSLSTDEALKLVETGTPIVLLSSKSKDGKIFFLINKDGSSAAKRLANYAKYSKVRVSGSYKFVNRTRYIVVDTIEPAN